MRGLRGFLIAALLLALGAGAARAAPLSFSGSLSLQIGTLPGATLAGSGVATVNGSAGGSHQSSLALAGGTFGPLTTSIPLTAQAEIQSIRYTGLGNLAGGFSGLSGAPPGGGAMGLTGLAKICGIVFDLSCQIVFLPIPFTPMTGVGFGLGGTQQVAGAVSLTLQHAPWTIGQPLLNIHHGNSAVTTPMLPGGFAHGAGSGTSTTAASSGTVQLVTVTRAFTSLTSAFPELPVLGVLKLHFVPEPGTLLLLGSGGVGLALLGRRRRSGAD